MRIDRISWYPVDLPRQEPFATSQHVSDVARIVFLRIDADGLEGWGAASPSEVTGETSETVVETLQTITPSLRGYAFERARQIADRVDEAISGHPAAKAAIDLAVFDLLGKAKGVPVHRMLGGVRDAVMTDRTVGLMDPESAAAKAKAFVREGFHAVKVKLEGRTDRDAERIRLVRQGVGNHIQVRSDANQAFSYRQALAFSRQAYTHVVEFFEQPLPADDLEGMRSLTESSPIPVMADESVVSPQDAAKVGWAKCARLVNLKLMKTGGLSRALEANAICESAGMPTMIGCNAESALSIAAGAHLALSQKNVRFADLDSHFSLEGDPASGLRFENGYLRPSGKPGLGMDVRL